MISVSSARGQTPSDDSPEARYEKWMSRARELFDQGCYNECQTWFKGALAFQPQSTEASAGLEKAKQALASTQGPAFQREMDATQQVYRKLSNITFPLVLFDHARLADAVERLRGEIIQMDTAANSDHQGVKIIVRYPSDISEQVGDEVEEEQIPGLPAESPQPPPVRATADSTVTLHLAKIPALDAMRYVAAHVGLTVKIHNGSIYLTGRNYVFPEEVIEKEFRVTPEDLAVWKDQWLGKEIHSVEDIKGYLKKHRVTFPQSATVSYQPTTGRLVTRNTQENIDLIETAISDAINYRRNYPNP